MKKCPCKPPGDRAEMVATVQRWLKHGVIISRIVPVGQMKLTKAVSFSKLTMVPDTTPIISKNSQEIFTESNWDNAFQTGGFWQNDLTISGGNDKATIFVSLGSLDQDGIARNSFYKRYNADSMLSTS